MAYTKATRKARSDAREAGLAQRRQRLEETKAELRSLVAFLTARRRLAEVDVWLDEKLAAIHAKAETQRAALHREATQALADMTARGMTVEEIARMAGMTAETVHGYLTQSTRQATAATSGASVPRLPMPRDP